MPNGLQLARASPRTYRNQREHDPIEHRPGARDRLARGSDPGRHPVSRTRTCPCYEDLRHAGQVRIARIHPRRPEARARQVHRLARGRCAWHARRVSDAPSRTCNERESRWNRSTASGPADLSLTGRCQGDGLTPIDGLGAASGAAGAVPRSGARCATTSRSCSPARRRRECVRSLSGLVDAVLRDVAPRGIEGERLRRHVLQLERGNPSCRRPRRHRHARRAVGQAAATLGAREGETLEQVLRQARRRLARRRRGAGLLRRHAGPSRHACLAGRAASKARRFQAEREPSRAAALGHPARRVQPLAGGTAAAKPQGIDRRRRTRTRSISPCMSRIVAKGAPSDELPAARRERLVRALGVLESQPFFAAPALASRRGGPSSGSRSTTAPPRRGHSASACRSSPNW